MIQIVNFSKAYKVSYNKVHLAVDDVSVTIEPNTITGLLGANGAGKTTILKAITAEHYATSGNIYVYDKGNKIDVAVNPNKVHEIVGYVSETPSLYENLSVKEFLNIVADLRVAKSQKIEAINSVIEKCSLGDVLKQRISSLSKGYKQRVSFAQALIHDPSILVLDEPSSGLDPNQIHQIREFIKSLSKNKTILLSTHIMQEAESMCQNILILSKGKIIANGTSDKIKKDTKSKSLEEAFLKLNDSLETINEK